MSFRVLLVGVALAFGACSPQPLHPSRTFWSRRHSAWMRCRLRCGLRWAGRGRQPMQPGPTRRATGWALSGRRTARSLRRGSGKTAG